MEESSSEKDMIRQILEFIDTNVKLETRMEGK
ncbi:hypothetical protein CCACVL1_25203 [Corchorus capsularis]|uniref:Uncharacterized protein n=1 Tax=Corchorus capsularis TaxID=210143 RepID=A0A1R3GLK3_COCAP|nr:hypothetical protein CCACVL1_25203 [Corchorus capsularis]